MTADLIIGAVIAVALAAALGGLLWQRSQDQAAGAQLEAGKVNAVSLTAETAIAQAEVDAPSTVAATQDVLKSGGF